MHVFLKAMHPACEQNKFVISNNVKVLNVRIDFY